MYKLEWYTCGEIGESVRDIMESFLDDVIDASTAIKSLSEIGMSNDEMMELINQELEVKQSIFH